MLLLSTQASFTHLFQFTFLVNRNVGSTVHKEQLQQILTSWNNTTEGESISALWLKNNSLGLAPENIRMRKELNASFFRDLDIMLLAYAIDNPSSLLSVYTFWSPLLKQSLPHAQVFLVGTKTDMRPREDGKPSSIYEYGEGSLPGLFLDFFSTLPDCLCRYLPLATLVQLGQTCHPIHQFISENFKTLYLQSLRIIDFVSPSHGRYMAKLISAMGWGECVASKHPGWRNGDSKERESLRKEIATNLRLGIKSAGAVSKTPVPEVDRIWGRAIMLFYESVTKSNTALGLSIMKWD